MKNILQQALLGLLLLMSTSVTAQKFIPTASGSVWYGSEPDIAFSLHFYNNKLEPTKEPDGVVFEGFGIKFSISDASSPVAEKAFEKHLAELKKVMEEINKKVKVTSNPISLPSHAAYFAQIDPADKKAKEAFHMLAISVIYKNKIFTLGGGTQDPASVNKLKAVLLTLMRTLKLHDKPMTLEMFCDYDK